MNDAENMVANQVILVGTVCRPPTLHYSADGKAMAVVDLRTESPEKPGNHDFHNVAVLDSELAEWCKKHLAVGTEVRVDGQLAQRRWKQGDRWRSQSQVMVRRVTLERRHE